MIVTCGNCDSAFTVSDDKVKGKKFAFSCPSCSHNNIIDNRADAQDELATAPLAEEKERVAAAVSDEATSDAIHSPTPAEDTAISRTEENMPQEEALSNLPDSPDSPDSDEDPFFEDLENPFEDDASDDLEHAEDIDDDLPLPLPVEDDNSFDEEVTVDLDSLDIELEDETSTTEMSEGDEEALSSSELNDDIDVEAILNEDEEFSLTIEEEETTASTTKETVPQSTSEENDDKDLTIDLDNLDITLEEEESLLNADLPTTEDESLAFESSEIAESSTSEQDDDITIDMENLNIELDEISTDEQNEALKDDDITIDMDALDIELEDSEPSSDNAGSLDLDSDTIDMDDLDIELDEVPPLDNQTIEDEIEFDLDDDTNTGEPELTSFEDDDLSLEMASLESETKDAPAADETQDEKPHDTDQYDDITIDLDSLDVELEEDALGDSVLESKSESEQEDESITIDIDSLDIDLDHEAQSSPFDESEDEDESITIDLDTLDIGDQVITENASGEVFSDDEEDERLSLADGGLSIDQIDVSPEEEAASTLNLSIDDEDEDELHLTSSEVNLDLDSVETLEDERDELYAQPAHAAFDDERSMLDDLDDDLPEIDLEKFNDDELGLGNVAVEPEADSFIAAQESSYVEDEDESMVLGPGYIMFSIDYALSYSRLRALLKLLGIFYISFIPHFIVMMLYSLVSSIVGFLNQIVILFTGKAERDFTHFQEKTLRYAISLNASMLNLVEERPPYAGTASLDYQMQLTAHPPIKRSKLLAFLRISGVGILFITIPHIIILAILSCAVSLFFIVALFWVLIFGKWPSFLFDFMVRYHRYLTNIAAFISGITDSYPSFRFD